MTFGNEKIRIDQTNKKYWRLKVKFSLTCSMKSMGSGWENLKIKLGLVVPNEPGSRKNYSLNQIVINLVMKM